MKKNICIIHFNTPVLTRCLVQSINKYTPGANIYIFDNSDKKPFINIFDNVTVLDNTKGQLVDFNEILKKYPKRTKSRGKTNNYGSAKHSIAIQKCVEILNEDFVLLDSDVLLKRDISPVWNERYVWVAGVEDWQNKTLVGATKRKRVCPFLLYMNVKKMNELGITFYDDTHMLGFNNGPKCEEYETGVWFYEATPKNKRKIINYSDYIVHFRAGSWLDDARTKQRYKQIEPEKWLIRNKKYWTDANTVLPKDWYKKYEKMDSLAPQQTQPQTPQKEIDPKKIDFSATFDHIYCLHYLPATDRLSKIKNELKYVGIDENANYFSWVYDYPSSLTDLVYEDKRLRMNLALTSSSRPYVKRVTMKHYEIIKEAYSLGYKRILILENDIRFHRDLDYVNQLLSNVPDTDIVMFDKMTCSAPSEATKYKHYVKSLPEGSLYGDMNSSGVFFIFCSCYALNRKAMQRIMELQEGGLLPPDTPLNDKSLTGSFAVTNLAIQDPKMKTRKVENYSKIGLDTTVYGQEEEEVTPIPEEPVVVTPVNNTAAKRAALSAIKKTEQPKAAIVPVLRNAPEKTIAHKDTQQKQATKPKTLEQIRRTVSKRPIIPDKTKRTAQTRVIVGQASGFNRLYDV